MKRGVCILWMVMAWLQMVCAGEWQWAVTLKGFVSDETKKEPEAFLWVPAHCERLSAVMWSQQNMTEEMLFDMPSFRDSLAEMGVGLIWIAPGIDQQWDVRKGTQIHRKNFLFGIIAFQLHGYNPLHLSMLSR